MVPLDIELIPSGTSMLVDFIALAGSISSFKEPLEDSIRQVAMPSIATNFDVGGRPGWRELADATQDKRAFYGFDDRPLIKSGRLANAAGARARWSVDQEDAWISNLPNTAWYGVVQDQGAVTGTTQIPARPFFVLQEEDLDDIEDIFAEWVERKFYLYGFVPGIDV